MNNKIQNSWEETCAISIHSLVLLDAYNLNEKLGPISKDTALRWYPLLERRSIALLLLLLLLLRHAEGTTEVFRLLAKPNFVSLLPKWSQALLKNILDPLFVRLSVRYLSLKCFITISAGI